MMQKFSIRESKKLDLKQILKLYSELIPNEKPLENVEAQNIYKEILESKAFKIFVLEMDSKIISSCALSIIPNLTRGGKSYAIIENVITDSNYRKQGCGSALMKHVISFALENNCYKIMLQTDSKNPNTHLFYKKLGFSDNEKQAFVIKII